MAWATEHHSALADVLGARRTINAAVASELAFMDEYVRSRTAGTSPWGTGVTEKDMYSSAICEVAAALSSTFAAIDNKLQMWRQLRPLVRQGFVDGVLDLERVRTIHDHLLQARPETVVVLEVEILKAAQEMAPGALGREIDRLLTEADADWDRAVRKRAARTEKRIRLRRRARGLSSLTTLMTDGEADEQLSRIDAEVTRLHPEDPRSDDQRRGDAQTALMRGETLLCECATCQVVREDGTDPAPENPAHGDSTTETSGPTDTISDTTRGTSTDSSGLIPLERELPTSRPPDAPPADTTEPATATPSRPGGGTLIERWRAIVGDDPIGVHALYPDGHGGMKIPPPGALSYTPGRALAAKVRAENPYCLHPGCNVPSERCDLDHIVEFDRHRPEKGGWTILTNIGPRCRLHHNLKTRKLWRTELLPEGVLHIVDPLGNHYFTPPSR
ncbi:HNH endonuclease [Rhodococcus sp. 1R11]|uniref:HNH endonuclease signature motif containing protein n=1 Tax=Rhodococcus sp. 1R11 TaxID=2559614 RepID=UPI001071AEBB|nr:HNH endonuclease signature motif containing protein [Rhodococcus sp. 1R11]TFI45630.1 HNH endonuclease [Rhodococcus sp. 1R11]